jgi:large-conductance mechanosensitive channel
MMGFLRDFTRFLLRRKKFWLAPVLVIMLAIGAIVVFSQGSVLAPLIYTIF